MATVKKKASAADRSLEWPFDKKNYVIFAVALVVIIAGFIFLSLGDITMAPILLVIGFVGLVPYAILARGKVDEDKSEPIDESGS